jgi:two-component system, chemotaxis family, CheB/CheR fusion protein
VTDVSIDEGLDELLDFLRDERGFDFSGYKRPSLSRRIHKRMHDARVDNLHDYRLHLERHPDEFARLFDTILINVTSFFRDKPAWDYVQEEIVPRIGESRSPADPIRVWSTGCSTGEEAYTTAMVFAEVLGEEDYKRRVKIYATDVDDDALGVGRHASYRPDQLDPVPAELREKYFEQTNGACVFRGDLRRTVIFGRHDLVQDPPISRIDFLVSRNTLMYFDAEAQERILENFHFGLRDDGFLFLGKSEVLAARLPLFDAVDLKRRVFAKVTTATRERPAVPIPGATVADVTPDALRETGFEASPVAQILIDLGGRLVAANLQARMMFGLNQRDIGTPLQDLELSYRPIELRSRIEQAYTERHVVSLRDVEWHSRMDTRFLDIQIAPLISPKSEIAGAAISFTDVSRSRVLQQALQESKREVENAYEELQSTVEELETTNEELQSTNEELETTNEELQSTNEELETMNEELQSTNEELETINDELHQRTDEVNDANAFLESVLRGLKAAVIVVDDEFRVQEWNAAAEDLWGLRRDEVHGSHFLNLDIGLPLDQLRNPIVDVLKGGVDGGVEVDAVNRRGRPVRVDVKLAALSGDGGLRRGAVLMMESAERA